VTVVGVDTTVLLVAGACVLAAVVLALLVVAPWKGVRNEPPLDDEVETRLLLGEDPAQIAADVDAAEPRGAVVRDLVPEPDDGFDDLGDGESIQPA
jgi:hypothetical protein